MSYQTGSATDTDDLITKLDSFLTGTPGWTSLLLDTTGNRAAWSKADSGATGWTQYVYAWWDTTNIRLWGSRDAPGSPIPTFGSAAGIRFSSNRGESTTFGQMTNLISTGPYPSYYFFEDDDYCHVVVERTTGFYRHFGFGRLSIIGNSLQRGEYVYSGFWDQDNAAIDVILSGNHQAGVGCLPYGSNEAREQELLILNHAEDTLSLDSPETVWFSTGSTSGGVDGDSVGRGLFRPCAGIGTCFSPQLSVGPSSFDGYVPLYPCPVFTLDNTPAPDIWRLVGWVKDTYTVNIRGYEPGEEISVGGDTYTVFPVIRKLVPQTSDNTEQSGTYGYAYKKVTT